MVYALLVERAAAEDLAELQLSPEVDKAQRAELCRNRDELDVWLDEPWKPEREPSAEDLAAELESVEAWNQRRPQPDATDGGVS